MRLLTSYVLRCLKESSLQYEQGDRKEDDEPGDVDQGRHEGRRRTRGVEPHSTQHERQHGTGQRTEQHDTDQRQRHGYAHQQVVRSIVVQPESLLGDDTKETDHPKDRSEGAA